MRKKYPTGAGVCIFLLLPALITELYLEYRGVMEITSTVVFMTFAVCGMIGLASVSILKAALFRRWQDEKRARETAWLIDLIILGLAGLLALTGTIILRLTLRINTAGY